MTSTYDRADGGLDLVVARRRDEADGVVSLELRYPDGAPLPAWEPGAHIDVQLGGGGAEFVRQYSLCSLPGDRTHWRIAVLREPDGRGGSQYVHERLRKGDTVHVSTPRNHFRLEPAKRYLFLAGGIGVTPLLPMLDEAERQGAEWQLVYGGRSLDSMAFRGELAERYGSREGDSGRVLLRPQDTHGLLDLDAVLGAYPPDTPVYCCGPEPLLRAVEERCTDRPEAGALHVERFAAKPQQAVEGGAFEVELAQSGVTLAVPPGTTVLDAVEQAGVAPLSSCREGTCGTCETEVLAGTVDHRDSLLTPAEQARHDTMMICVSRAAGPRLVLDL